MEKSRRLKIIVSSVFVFLLFVGTLLSSLDLRKVNVGEDVLGDTDIVGIPRIISIAPVNVSVGNEYVYYVDLVDSDTSEKNLVLSLDEGPTWLDIENGVVSGFPRREGTYKFVVRVSDGVKYSLQENYILVSE